ncbi:hypothetical protein N7528_007480 [Penicillium herquei]|nr:hypothetical protein N7528_007480 [Penicillium herquei]
MWWLMVKRGLGAVRVYTDSEHVADKRFNLCCPDWRLCYSCGEARSEEDAAIIWNPHLEVDGVKALITASDAKPAARAGDHC